MYERRWTLHPHRPDLAESIAARLRLHPLVGQILINRGADSADAAQRYLDRELTALHDPDLLPGATAAADRLFHAAKNGKEICVFGDYDADGMCAASILYEALRLADAKVRFYVPDRLEEGYGVNAAAVRKLKQGGVDTIVTVDCGIAGVEEAALARSLGLEYIVTDHHQFGGSLPEADVLVHPGLPGSAYPNPHLCGTGVAFKVAWQFGRLLSGGRKTSEAFKQFLLYATTLTAIGTIADVMPLSGENRAAVHHGLRSLRSAPPLGLRFLLEAAKLADSSHLTSEDIGFRLAPRLNACGRLGQARLGIELLTTRSESRASELAHYLDEENRRRQSIERKMLHEAQAQAEAIPGVDDRDACPILVLDSSDWHAGVIGIVAGKIGERFRRPAILIAWPKAAGGDAKGMGSARSTPGFSICDALNQCADLLESCGGHAAAAGLSIRRDRLEAFREKLTAVARAQMKASAASQDLMIDAEAPLFSLNSRLIRSLDVLEPFGQGNPSPLLLATNLTVEGEPKLVGNGDRHLKFRVSQGDRALNAIAFDQGNRLEELVSRERKCCLAFQPTLNTFNGFTEVQLRVTDLRPGPSIV